MIFETIAVGPLSVNCYILGCEKNGEGIVIDPGGNVAEILHLVKKHNLKISTVINTHGHFDHIGGNKELLTASGARLFIHQADSEMLGRAADVGRMYGMKSENSPDADAWLFDGMEFSFGNCSMKVLHTPGHTQGCCCLYFADEKIVITGDTLFAESIGRTDLPGGSHEQILESIRTKLFTLPDNVIVYPGHGKESTIGYEKANNPYF